MELDAAQIHRRNLILNVCAEGLWGFAVAFHNVQTVIPVLLSRLGASPFLVGLIPGGFILLVALPELLSVARFSSHPDLKKLNIQLHAAILPFAAMMVLLFLVFKLTGPWAIGLYLLCWVGYSLAVGQLLPVWADFLAAVSLPQKRGRFFGITFAFNALMGMLGGWTLRAILASPRLEFPANFGLGFLILVVAASLGTACFLGMRTIDYQPAPVQVFSLKQALGRILKADVNFRWYIVSRMFGAAAFMPLAFYAVDFQQRYGLELKSTGDFILTLVAANMVFNYLFGSLSDRVGRKRVVAFFFVGHLAAAAAALLIQRAWVPYLVFALVGMSQGAAQSSFMVFIYDFAGTTGNRKLYYALLDTAVAPVLLVFILSAGNLVTWLGLERLYAISLGFIAVGLLIFLVKVKRPLPAG